MAAAKASSTLPLKVAEPSSSSNADLFAYDLFDDFAYDGGLDRLAQLDGAAGNFPERRIAVRAAVLNFYRYGTGMDPFF